jgi:hypothetical protein
MGMQRENGYSATVEGFFVLNGKRLRVAKTNGRTLVLAEPSEFAPGTAGELLIIVDGHEDSRRVMLPDGAVGGQTLINYEVVAPF